MIWLGQLPAAAAETDSWRHDGALFEMKHGREDLYTKILSLCRCVLRGAIVHSLRPLRSAASFKFPQADYDERRAFISAQFAKPWPPVGHRFVGEEDKTVPMTMTQILTERYIWLKVTG